MIRLLLIEDKDKVTKNYVICPNCDIKIMYTEQTPHFCPICQADIPPIISYLNSLGPRIRYYRSNSYILSGLA